MYLIWMYEFKGSKKLEGILIKKKNESADIQMKPRVKSRFG